VGPPAKKLFCALLKEMGVEYWPEHQVMKVTTDGNRTTVHFAVGGEGETKSVAVDGLFCTFPQRAPDFVAPFVIRVDTSRSICKQISMSRRMCL